MSIAETVPRVRIPFAPPASLNRRETAPPFAAKYAKIPYFVIFRPQSGLERTDCPGSNGVNLPAFLWTAHAQSGFSDFNGRMQRDHKPMMWRKRRDLVKPWECRSALPTRAFELSRWRAGSDRL